MEKRKKLEKEELKNVNGGCSSYSRDSYGDLGIYCASNQIPGNHPLIVTIGNSCGMYTGSGEGLRNCMHCRYFGEPSSEIIYSKYCKTRSIENDPMKK